MTETLTHPLALFDPYTFRARLQPALIALLPLGIAGYAWSGGKPSWVSALWGLFGMAGGTFLLTVLTRRLGRSLEPGLWRSWGGAPTTQLLRHRGDANPLMRARWHDALAKLTGAPLPSAPDEQANPQAADFTYEAAAKVAIGKTRNVRTFGLLFKEDIAYGFCRNLYALRPYGIFFALVGTALAAAAGVQTVRTGGLHVLEWFCAAADLGALFVWIFYVNDSLVRTPAFAYAERLFEAIDLPVPSRPSRRKPKP
jgi:hypothetical protein